MTTRRVVDSRTLAAYLSYEDDTAAMHAWVRDTLGVAPVKGRRGMWDLRAIDAALDRVSRISAPSSAHDPYEAWKSGDAA